MDPSDQVLYIYIVDSRYVESQKKHILLKISLNIFMFEYIFTVPIVKH